MSKNINMKNSTKIGLLTFLYTLFISFVLISFFHIYLFIKRYQKETTELQILKTSYSTIYEILGTKPSFEDLKYLDIIQASQLTTFNYLWKNIYFKNWNYFLIDKLTNNYFIKYDISDYIKPLINSFFVSLIFALIASVLIFFLAKKFFSHLILKDINKISKKISELNTYNLKPLSTEDIKSNEYKSIIYKINSLIEQINQYQQNLKNFNYQVSHEFKTPLTIIQNELEYLNAKGLHNTSLEKIYLQTEKLNNLLESFLLLNKLSTWKIKNEDTLNIYEQINTILSELKQIYNKNLKINIKIPPSFKIIANKELFNILLKNILENSFKYWLSYINIFFNKNEFSLIIENDFDPSKQRNWNGFGLTIAKNIAQNLSINLEFFKNTNIFKATLKFNK